MNTNSIEAEYNAIQARKAWTATYEDIKYRSDEVAREKKFTLDESKKNKKLNRYRDVNPYDHSRIVIKRGDTDYINANLVVMEKANRQYILCQGPLETTVGHFWSMIWEQNSKAILMLNKLVEKRQTKCHLYWPEKIGEDYKLDLPEFGLSVEYMKIDDYNYFSKRYFRLTDKESSSHREVVQFHYTTWPDFGIPSSPIAFLQFLKQVRDSGALDSNVGPPVIHCSAGIGRSGTFCLVDCCLVLIDKEGENNISVQNILLELRQYRMGLIQTVDQLIFSYQAIIEGIKRMNNPTFNEMDDLEILSKSNTENDDDDDDEDDDRKPPPLPPQRESSLNKVQLKNQLNNEITKEFIHNEKSNINRPLPALPHENSLEKVNESISNEENSDDEDETMNEEKISDYDTDSEDDNENESNFSNNVNQRYSSDFNANASLPPLPNNGYDMSSESYISSPEHEKSPNSELRRRAREDRHSAMEEKIKEIKRKQKEVENRSTASKKRRSLIYSLAAGVIFGVICVYYYTHK